MGDQEQIITLGQQYRQSVLAIEKFAAIQQQILQSDAKKVVLDVQQTTHIADGLLLLLAVLPDFRSIYGKSIVIRYNKQNKKMFRVLSNSGVLEYYTRDGSNPADEGSIPFKKTVVIEEYADLVKRIMRLAPVNFSEQTYSVMFSKLYEIFDNARTHGKNELGTYTYGMLNDKEFVFSIYDAGVGIQKNVNDYLHTEMSPRAAIEWALTSGNTTLVTDYPRGAGLSLLEEFAYKNEGKITLCSNNIVCIMQNGKRHFRRIGTSIQGTLFIMNIRADSKYY